MAKSQQSSKPRALDRYQAALAMEGDKRAFELLYKRWHIRLLRHAVSLLGDSEEARDVMQDVAVALVRNIRKLKDPDHFGAWAYTIVRNRAASHIRRKSRDRTLQTALQRSETPEETAPRETTSDVLIDLISTLKPAHREVLSAYYVDGMSVREIAACLMVPPGTVKSRLSAARTHLKSKYYSPKGQEHE